MNRVALMATLSLIASLSSCAPRITGPAGEDYTPGVRIGSTIYFVPRVPLAELTDQTPDTTFVLLPGCTGGAVAARDVRRLGAAQAEDACQVAVRRGLGVIGGVVALASALALVVYLFFIRLFQATLGSGLLLPVLKGHP